MLWHPYEFVILFTLISSYIISTRKKFTPDYWKYERFDNFIENDIHEILYQYLKCYDIHVNLCFYLHTFLVIQYQQGRNKCHTGANMTVQYKELLSRVAKLALSICLKMKMVDMSMSEGVLIQIDPCWSHVRSCDVILKLWRHK